ncbi:hypothetical protein [Microbacterium halotolerans]|uniref:hypothetical protein n=1 Tax=Microbacterium halotolerans TaxID=246613 RepID=UPI000E6A9C30|nr:hypothetical protein [Microbacterium halotolerans]
MRRTPVFARITGIALGAAAVCALTGCFSNPLDDMSEGLAQGGAEKIVEGITEGETDVEFGDIPDDFPDEITLVSDTVVQGMSINSDDGTGTMVMVSDSRSVDELAQQVKTDFADWEETVWSDMGEMVTGIYTLDETLSVTVGIVEGSGDEDTMVSYTAIVTEP